LLIFHQFDYIQTYLNKIPLMNITGKHTVGDDLTTFIVFIYCVLKIFNHKTFLFYLFFGILLLINCHESNTILTHLL